MSESDPNRHQGLDLGRVEATDAAEAEAFRAAAVGDGSGHPRAAYALLLAHRPDLLKLHFRQARAAAPIPGEGSFRALTALAMLHWYCCNRQAPAVAHELRVLAGIGGRREEALEVLGLAFVHAGVGGLSAVGAEAAAALEEFAGDAPGLELPPAWERDPAALECGLDPATTELSEDERESLFGWYREAIGEVPRSVLLLAELRPEVLKAQRMKLGATMRGALPKQVLPYVELHYQINRGCGDGIRDAALLARGWGMTSAEVAHAVAFATGSTAGLESLHLVDRAIGPLLVGWE